VINTLKFASAAFVGIVAGVILALTSSVVTSVFGMTESDEELSRPSTADSLRLVKREESSSYETDWNLLSPTKRKKGKGQGLLSQVIHEEDDDSV